MQYKREDRGGWRVLRIFKAMTTGWIVTIALTAIVSFLIDAERLQEKMMTISAVIITVISSMLVAYMSGRKHDAKIIWSIAGGLSYYLSLIGCNVLIYDGNFSGLTALLLTITGCSLVCGLALTKQKHMRPKYLKWGRK